MQAAAFRETEREERSSFGFESTDTLGAKSVFRWTEIKVDPVTPPTPPTPHKRLHFYTNKQIFFFKASLFLVYTRPDPQQRTDAISIS